MTDEAYAFKQTEIERKRSARGAFAKKGGSRSKKCSLPSDRLTAKQRKELNGKVETVRMNKPMKWKEFSYLSADIQKLYLTNLAEQYGARRKDAAEMFGITPNALTNYLNRNFLSFHPFAENNGQKHVSPRWLKFLGCEETSEPEVKEPIENAKPQETPISCVKQNDLFSLGSGELRFRGDLRSVLSKMLVILEPSGSYELTISFQKLEVDSA